MENIQIFIEWEKRNAYRCTPKQYRFLEWKMKELVKAGLATNESFILVNTQVFCYHIPSINLDVEFEKTNFQVHAIKM